MEGREPGRSALSHYALRLADLLRQLPERELSSLIDRMEIAVDQAKRIDVASQVARALVSLPEVRDPAGYLPGATAELLFRIAEAKGVLVLDALPPAVAPLVHRGIVFARGGNHGGVELILPIAYMVQVRSWQGDDPRGARALLAQASPEVASSIASHYLGRPATPPLALSLEPAWEVMNDPQALAKEVEALAPLERKLLKAVEKVGGEVDTEELLDLEREPMRLRGATGATPSRRGVGFALERRGFLIPVYPNRHVVPTEVAAVVGAQRRAERDAQRREILSYVLAEDHAPRRARFAEDPVPLALALALAVRDPSVDVRPGVGTPRSLVSKLATRFGKHPDSVALIAALSRAMGLWDASVISVTSPPGASRVGDLGRLLFETWLRGGAWDEARPDGEVLRVTAEAREASAVGVLRRIVLDALRELGDGRWAPWEAVAAFVRADSRTPGLARLLERWAQRAGVEVSTPAEIAQRIACETLHSLGVVDLGDPSDDSERPTLRITPRGRAYITGTALPNPDAQREGSRFVDGQVLRIGPADRIGSVVALSPLIEIGSVTGSLDVSVTQHTLSLALAAGFDADNLKGRLEALAQLPDPIERMLTQASAVLGRAEYVPTQGFLWVEDNEIREMLRTRRQTADLFVDPSPPAGLLLSPGTDIERVARRCRSLGVEVVVDGEVYRTRSLTPPPRNGSAARRYDRTEPPTSNIARKHTGTRRRSSTQTPALKRKP
ncbi:MAG: hypothetical protein HS104_07520 [Polyangiaceae bacterium]|nr:hypothetical protein [Polyangiaceae bacterium]MCL4749402.1 hypothetical protein [Myxococcales bacterium]